MRRSLTAVLVVVATAAVTWLTWPRPDLRIAIAPGGVARVLHLWGADSLGDTVYVHAAGPVRVHIENADTVEHRLGIFAVGSRSASDYTIAEPGVYRGYCSTHPSRSLTYIIR